MIVVLVLTPGIDLIITSQPFLFVEHDIHPSLFKNCHHEIVHGKLSLSVPPPPAFKQKLWYYSNADIDTLRDKLRRVDWHAVFSGLDVNMMAKTFTDLVLTAITDTILNKPIICNSNDPPWMTPEIKTAVRRKHRVHKKYVSGGRKIDELADMRVVRNEIAHFIDRAKEHSRVTYGKGLLINIQKLVFQTYLPPGICHIIFHKRMKIGRITELLVLNPVEITFFRNKHVPLSTHVQKKFEINLKTASCST